MCIYIYIYQIIVQEIIVLNYPSKVEPAALDGWCFSLHCALERSSLKSPRVEKGSMGHKEGTPNACVFQLSTSIYIYVHMYHIYLYIHKQTNKQTNKERKNKQTNKQTNKHKNKHTYIHTLHCTALHCIALHCVALHCITLHYIPRYLDT